MKPKGNTRRKKGNTKGKKSNTSSSDNKVTYLVEIPSAIKDIKERIQSELIRSELRFILVMLDKYTTTPTEILQIQEEIISKFAEEHYNANINEVEVDPKKETTSRVPSALEQRCKDKKIPVKKSIEIFQGFSLKFQAIYQNSEIKEKVDYNDILCGERMKEHFEHLSRIGHIKRKMTKIFGMDIDKKDNDILDLE